MRKRWLLSIVIMLFPFVASFAADPEEGTYPTVGADPTHKRITAEINQPKING